MRKIFIMCDAKKSRYAGPPAPFEGVKFFPAPPLAIDQKSLGLPLVSGQKKMWSTLKISGNPHNSAHKFWTLPKMKMVGKKVLILGYLAIST